MVLLANGGILGGLNFDAKTRRSSTDLEDIFIGHISSMDTLARGLMIAHKILVESDIPKMKKQRYASYDSGQGAAFERGKLGLEDLRKIAVQSGEPKRISGKQELYEQMINMYLM